jgi:CRP/FNR family transcriptional regulator
VIRVTVVVGVSCRHDVATIRSTSMTTSPAASALATVPLFAGLDGETRGWLERASRVRTYPQGQMLCSEGDPGDELLVLEAGRVRVSRFAGSGQEIVLAELTAPASFGELALIDHQPRAATLTAISEVRIRYIGRGPVMDLVAREPAVAIAMLRGLVAMVRATNERLEEMLTLDVPGRLAKWLLAHEAGGQVSLGQSQESLARSLGTTRETLNRTLRRFERPGWIEVDGRAIRVRDPTALESIAAT